MTVYAVATVRELVHGLVSGAAGTTPVYRWLPNRTELLPCYVIGRPDLDEDPSRRVIANIAVPVYACGRTLRDDDAQHELDGLADVLVSALWKPPPTEGVTLRLTRLRATVTPVAELEIPTYTATVLAATTYC